MDIKKIAIERINPAVYNPRKDLQPGDAEYEKLKKSIMTFDIVEPLVWNKRTGNLVGGHQRFKIIKNELKLKEVEVSVVDLDEKKERALNLALNKVSGEWDMGRLADLLKELNDGTFDMSLTGFDESELQELIDFNGRAGLVDDDAVPEPPKKAKTVRGDIYVMGEHRLMCGDSTSVDDVKELMDNNTATLVVTDPPYNTGMVGKNGSTRLNHMFDDIKTPEEWSDFLQAFFSNLFSFSKKDCAFYVFIDWRRISDVRKAMESFLSVSNVIVWDKMVHGLGSDYKYTYELIVVGKKGKPAISNRFGEDYQDVWHLQRKVGKNKDHATAKPVELCMKPIKHASKNGDVVLDLFGGSGTTMIAADKLNRRCFMMEIDPVYCDVIVKRWEEFSGKKAELLKKKVLA